MRKSNIENPYRESLSARRPARAPSPTPSSRERDAPATSKAPGDNAPKATKHSKLASKPLVRSPLEIFVRVTNLPEHVQQLRPRLVAMLRARHPGAPPGKTAMAEMALWTVVGVSDVQHVMRRSVFLDFSTQFVLHPPRGDQDRRNFSIALYSLPFDCDEAEVNASPVVNGCCTPDFDLHERYHYVGEVLISWDDARNAAYGGSKREELSGYLELGLQLHRARMTVDQEDDWCGEAGEPITLALCCSAFPQPCIRTVQQEMMCGPYTPREGAPPPLEGEQQLVYRLGIAANVLVPFTFAKSHAPPSVYLRLLRLVQGDFHTVYTSQVEMAKKAVGVVSNLELLSFEDSSVEAVQKVIEYSYMAEWPEFDIKAWRLCTLNDKCQLQIQV
ncbi:hypothetical protein CYMTET_27303 [Cymbomonas tetramitiformis]|uniref:Uncharacterized protein n=1 Tax=Cymbomonas tetramitiformis TaxID=36881 RepID=A0AAE0FQ31_9CHLO|nr:hypothetical protein CYMTET_27303 [Cymbomonas tetramitiformis]